MRGLSEYIEKHGMHFTYKLAVKVLKLNGLMFWRPSVIKKNLCKVVWYNVDSSTEGDIIYIVNTCPHSGSLSRAIRLSVILLQDVNKGGKMLFRDFINKLETAGSDFDFTPYI